MAGGMRVTHRLMMAALVVLALGGPAGGAEGAPGWMARPEGLRERARARVDVPVEAIGFEEGGPAVRVRGGETLRGALPVAEHTGEQVRVVLQSKVANLAVWLPRKALRKCALRKVWLAPTEALAAGRPTARSPGLVLEVGEPVTQVSPRLEGGLADVTWWHGRVRATVVGEAAAFGEVWPAGKARRKRVGRPNVRLRPGAVLTATPAKASDEALDELPFAWLGDPSRGGHVSVPTWARVVARRGEARLVRVETEGASLTGWVTADQVVEDGALGAWGTLTGGGGGGAAGDFATVREGATLHASPGGAVVGVVTAAEALLWVEERGDDGWARVRDLELPLGVPVWVRDAAEP